MGKVLYAQVILGVAFLVASESVGCVRVARAGILLTVKKTSSQEAFTELITPLSFLC
jgi:hypothetical protein